MTIPSVKEGTEKLEPQFTAEQDCKMLVMLSGTATLKISIAVLWNVKNNTLIT